MSDMADSQLAYVLLRTGFGINLAVHGLNRIIGSPAAFATKMVSDFAAVPIPGPAVLAFGYVLPFAELLVGLLMMVGAWLRPTLAAGSLLMSALMFGTALKGDWNILGTQLVYALTYYLLLARRGDDAWSVDTIRKVRNS